MLTPSHHVLDEPLLRVTQRAHSMSSSSLVTLPQALALIWQDALLSWDSIQPHQEQPWHCFLAQLGALAYQRMAWSQWPDSPEPWRQALLALTDGSEDAWCLVVPDLRKPALLQPPAPEGSLDAAGYLKNIFHSPEQIDVLITAKNLDVKIQRASHATPEQWLYALVSVQTQEGFLGNGNYGISRMNGGFGSRPMTTLTPSLEPGPWLRRDMTLLASHTPARPHGHALLWILPWDGSKESAIPLHQCHTYVIEICRRLRLGVDPSPDPRPLTQDLIAYRTTTKAARLDVPAETTGLTDDPWAPVLHGKLLTLSGRGFHYKLLTELLQCTHLAMSYDPTRDGPAPWLVCRALARGQGKTEGLHHRALPIPAQTTRRLFSRTAQSPQQQLAQRAKLQLLLVELCSLKILAPALIALAFPSQDASAKQAFGHPLVQRTRDAFEQRVDALFFPSLWDGLELDEAAHKLSWQRQLRQLAQDLLHDAITQAPLPAARRWRAQANATAMLNALLRQHFLDLYPTEPSLATEHHA